VTFKATAAPAVEVSGPEAVDTAACFYADDAALQLAYTNWLAGFTTDEAGCGSSGAFTTTPVAANTLSICSDVDISLTYTADDGCTSDSVTVTFKATAAPAVTYNDPTDANVDSCDFADQNAVDTAFTDWVNAQSAAIAAAGGCDPQLTNDSASASIPLLCDGGSATVTWTITDKCETINNITADFNLTAPALVTYNEPEDADVDACDFADQNAVDADFTSWVNTQSIAIALAGGCSPQLTNDSASVSIPQLCDGGSATVTWTIKDLCNESTVTAVYNLNKPADLSHYYPDPVIVNACDFESQEDFDTKFAKWVDDELVKMDESYVGGCNPYTTNNYTNQTIDICTGGTISITWYTNDKCQKNHTHTTTYTLNQPEAVSYTEPSDDTSVASEFDDEDATVAQANLDADIAAWVNAQTDVINNSLTGGCSPTVTNDFTDQSILFCSSGSITITWTIEDICGTTTVDATYSFTQPDGINFTDPSDDTVDACEFDNADPIAAQAALDADIAAWVDAQTDIINNSLTGGSPEVTNDFSNQSIDFCTGGSITITWTIEDICETKTPSATYTLTQPEPVAYTAPSDDSADACEFDNADPIAAQAALDADIAAWVDAQTDIINNSITGGCSPTVTNDFEAQSIDLCTGGSITITWTVEDICGTTNTTANYTLTQPETVSYTDPSDDSADACEFDNADPIAAQSALDVDIAAWVDAQTDIINSSLTGGCSPTVTNDFEAQSIDLCTGGSITITWTVEDICGTTNPTATYTLTQPETVSYTDPSDDSADACEFDNADPIAAQAALDADIAAWVDAQTDIINSSLTGGCTPTVTNDFEAQSIDLCTGGSITITWTVEDLCSTTTATATYTLSQPEAIVYTAPSNKDAISCDYTDQAGVDQAFADWVDAQTSAMIQSGGCSPELTNNSDTVSVPELCTGGTVTVIWTITDICETIELSADFSLTAPTAVAFDQESLPTDVTVECDNVPAAANLTAANSCGNVTVTYTEERTDGECPSSYILTRTWTATDICGSSIEHIQTVTVQDTTAPTVVGSFDDTVNVSCTNIPNAPNLEFEDNCSSDVTVEFSETSTYDENVFEDYTITRTWIVSDECGNTDEFTQTVNVALSEVVTQLSAGERCYDDGIVDLNTLVSAASLNGTWEILQGNTAATLQGSLFDPTTLEIGQGFLPQDGGIDYVFRYTAIENGCINVTELSMNINADCEVLPCGEDDVIISKALTPNGDGYNETFDIMGVDLCGFTANVKIFNRWGALIFESNNYSLGENMGGFTGKAKSSVGSADTVPNGTYYYIIVLENSGLKPFTGPLYIGTK
ncbi:gliding motility-associated C-terminal domain-containing protein, partial [Flavobacteriaceae bacterium XHP0103]|uniref:gliding motility-associated C-terminal domain-containing protein n=1 Tax=Marixanthotalea marina TaxID=2844359 RepID=UPI002989FB1C